MSFSFHLSFFLIFVFVKGEFYMKYVKIGIKDRYNINFQAF